MQCIFFMNSDCMLANNSMSTVPVLKYIRAPYFSTVFPGFSCSATISKMELSIYNYVNLQLCIMISVEFEI